MISKAWLSISQNHGGYFREEDARLVGDRCSRGHLREEDARLVGDRCDAAGEWKIYAFVIACSATAAFLLQDFSLKTISTFP